MAGKTTSCDIYTELFESIISGKLLGDTRLKEVELAKRFDVSRTPIREALRQLEQDGLVRILPAQGATIIPFTADDAEDVYDIRMMLELLAVDIAGSNLKLQKLTELRDHISTENKQNVQKQTQLDTDLHQYLINATGRRYLIAMYERTNRLMQHIRSLGFRNPETLARATTEHIEMIDAMLIRDIPAAKTIIRHHIQNSKTFILSLMHHHN